MTDRLAWAKPGTKAVIHNVSSIGCRKQAGHGKVVVIVRETPAQLVTDDGRRWRKADLNAIGGGGGHLESISWLIGQRVSDVEQQIRQRLTKVWRGGGEREALVEVAALVAAAIADIDALEAPATEVTS